jgi:beta-lysine 5,6-aminomutase alpha subunit
MKLDLDRGIIEECRACARAIADEVVREARAVTTTSIERAVVRLLGVDGVDSSGVPLPNVLVDEFRRANRLAGGAAQAVAELVALGMTPQQVAETAASGELRARWCEDTEGGAEAIDAYRTRAALEPYVEAGLARIRASVERRDEFLGLYGHGQEPLLYVIVATGNIYEDVVQAEAAAHAGADIIAVIRSTAQSLLDYVPYGATTEGYGGTFATQENFRIMRRALDEASAATGRYIRLVNYCSGLCMPEIAAMGAFERLDMMLNDSMYGILFRDINLRRTFADQYFSRMINAYADVVINTGEDNYLTTADAVDEAHTVLASQFINEALARRSGLRPDRMGLGHAFEIDPALPNSFLYELAHAQLARDIFPEAPLKYMPPTKHMTGDVFRGYVMNAMFNLVGVTSGQSIQLLGMLTEAIHTPHIQDRYLAVKNAKYVFGAARDLGNEISFAPGGIIQTRAAEVLSKAHAALLRANELGLPGAIAEGMFGGISRRSDQGRGLDGVIERVADYWNPFEDRLRDELGLNPSEGV